MNKSFKRVLLSSLVVLAPMFSACERVDDLSGVTDVRPSYSLNGNGNGKREAKLVRTSTAVSSSQTGQVWVNGGQAGRIVVGQFELFIPKGAVKHPTLFVMTASDDGLIKVALNAYEFGSPMLPVTRFRQALKLTMPYGNASEEFLSSAGNWIIANISEDGLDSILEIVNVSVNRQNLTVTGMITHFSTYAVAKEIIIGLD